jgi:hypothetical protein
MGLLLQRPSRGRVPRSRRPRGPAAAPRRPFGHVFVIIGENTDYQHTSDDERPT